MSYADPENIGDVVERLKNLKTLGEVKKLVDEVFPTWFVTVLPAYSNDYNQLDKNWRTLCSELKVKPAQIMIVDFLQSDSEHTLISTFAECFTRAGFSVRRKSEFIPCQKCSKALPTMNMWRFLKEKGHTVPETWRHCCLSCSS